VHITAVERVSIDSNNHWGYYHRCRGGRFNLCVNKCVTGISTQGGFDNLVYAIKKVASGQGIKETVEGPHDSQKQKP
jgi:D-arabinose 1-dehydrogenase-like Zn-dependent alcohol dehydrogenase